MINNVCKISETPFDTRPSYQSPSNNKQDKNNTKTEKMGCQSKQFMKDLKVQCVEFSGI